MEESLILQYTKIIIQHKKGSPQAKEFYEKHSDDPVFVRGAKVLHSLSELKKKKP